MPVNQSEAPWPALRRASRTVVVVDVVESVRLMEQDEDDTIRRWQSFVGEVVTRLLPQHGGRLVKSLGDGLMLEFESVLPAVQSALAMQQAIQPYNHGRASEQWMCLRVGVHVADVVVDERDIYGAGVNLAARLATLGGPGEIVVSEGVLAGLVPGLDATVEDMGECFLKHLSEPLRAYRVGAVGLGSILPRHGVQAEGLLPTVAVIPFGARDATDHQQLLGEALADDVIAALSRSQQWRVVSRLSTTHFKGRASGLSEIGSFLGATYVLSGSYWVLGSRVKLSVELGDSRDGCVVWAETRMATIDDVFHAQDFLVPHIVASIGSAVLGRELDRACQSAMPALEGYTLLLHAIAQMHRMSVQQSGQAKEVLSYLVDRYPRLAEPRAWLGKWHFLQVAQAWSGDPALDAARAQFEVRRALEVQPDHALSLAIDGQICAFIHRDLDGAEQRFREALRRNSNEPLAWLFLSAVHCHRGDGLLAQQAVDAAVVLSPIDPLKYFYDIFAASAALVNAQYERAEELATASLRANRTHLSTYATLAIAQVLAGHVERARDTVRQMLVLRPTASVRRYVENHPGGNRPHVRLHADALLQAGVPH